MGERLGRIERPEAQEYKGKRKLYFVPLVFIPQGSNDELLKIVKRYWEEVQDRLMSLEGKLGETKRVYYELISTGGNEGVKAIEELKAGYQIVKERLDKGAHLEAIEDKEILTEFMDWRRCLGIGLQNEKVLNKVYEYYMDVRQRRYEHIAKRIEETLGPGEAGILLMEEGHNVRFPQDLEVFYIVPPSLDEIKQWIRQKVSATDG